MNYIIVGAIILLIAIALISSSQKAKREREQREFEMERRREEARKFHELDRFLDKQAKEIAEEMEEDEDEEPILLDDEHADLQGELATLQEQVAHLATVQMLTLEHLKLEHQIQPTKDVLIAKSEERG